MREFHGTATAFIDATPEAVFDFITDINRLPEWNAAIERVVEAPGSLTYGSEWVVVMHPSGLPRWMPVPHHRHLRAAIDGNASYIQWTWTIVAVDGGAQVTVMWDGHPMTF